MLMLGYAAIQHWPMNTEAFLQHLESMVSMVVPSMSHPVSTEVRVQPTSVMAQPKVAFRQMARTAGPQVRITRKAVDRPEETAPAKVAAPPAVLTKEAPEPPRLSGFIAISPASAEATGNPLNGPLSAVMAALPPPELPLERIRVGGQVAAAKLVAQTKPVYPPLARQGRVEGRVRLEAVVGRDGSVENLKLVSGKPLLNSAAILAVKQWRYQPTLLNGVPVEVVTTVDVDFRLPN
jgi:periplasmic protein TonB